MTIAITPISQDNNTNTNKFQQFVDMGPEATIKLIGGSDRGCINKAIRYLNAEGASKGLIAKLLNKRFQHVRNVLHADAENKKKGNNQTVPNQVVPASSVSILQWPVGLFNTQINSEQGNSEIETEMHPCGALEISNQNQSDEDDELEPEGAQTNSGLTDDELLDQMIEDELKNI